VRYCLKNLYHALGKVGKLGTIADTLFIFIKIPMMVMDDAETFLGGI
jgi:hypothetical protein